VPLVEIDRRLLSSCLKREPGAWEDFVDRFIGVFVHVIRHTAHMRSVELSQDDIEDLCAEIFLTLLKNDFAVLRHFKGHSSLATYLAIVARRIVVKSVTQRRKSEALGHIAVHQSALQAGGAEPARAVADIEEVRALMGQLPPSEAALVKAFYLDGLSYAEISRQLSIPENSIGPMLHRARERMRQNKVPSAS
jgi:RNA polymerase sigma-70 factor (ECF subfamily)